jgi:protein TonB
MNTIKKNLFAFSFILSGFTSLYSQNNKDTMIRSIDPPIIDYIPLPDSMRVFNISEIQDKPQFPGDINKYLADSIGYPEEVRNKNIQGGGVLVSFIVEKNGSVSNISIVRSTDTSLNSKVKRVISAMKWTPGKHNGVPVRVKEYQSVPFMPR